MNPFINGTMYSWADVQVMIANALPLTGIKSIDYEEDTAMQNNYGAGGFPVGQGTGNTKYTGSIELYKEEIAQLQLIAPFGKLQLIPAFTIKVVYGASDSALQIDSLLNVRFMKNAQNTKSGDMEMVTKIPLLIGSIAWNGQIM